MHTHIHSHTTRGHKAQTAHTLSACTNIDLTHPPISTPQHRRTRPHTPRPLVHSHHTLARNTRASTRSRTGSHPMHTPSCARPSPCSPAHTRAHPLTPRAHTLLRAPAVSLTGPRARAQALVHGRTPRAHTHAPTAEWRGAGRERPPVAGRARPGEGAARRRGVRPAPELFPGAPAARGSAGAGPAAPAGLGGAGRGGPQGARPGSRRRPRAERGGERAMDPKAGGGEEDDCVDSGAETGG